jgi:outer membrane protein assembly factor BamB
MSNSSPVILGDLIFVSTSNGQDESHVNIPSPKAPAIIALNKNTGKLVWEDNSVEDRILHGQWSTPVGRQDWRRRSGGERAGRRLGARLRDGRPARSCGSSTPTRRTRCGRRTATK